VLELCLTIPGRVIDVSGALAAVGEDGVRRNVNISLVRASLGDYVLVQSSFAVKLLPETETFSDMAMANSVSLPDQAAAFSTLAAGAQGVEGDGLGCFLSLFVSAILTTLR